MVKTKNIITQMRCPDRTGDSEESQTWLDGKLLVAMPSMADSRFEKAVIFLCAHDKKGAMGLIVNKTVPDLSMSKLLQNLLINVKDADAIDSMNVYVGGPVETQRGFLLHSNEYTSPDTIRIRNDLCVTGTVEALRDALRENGPSEKIFALGYAGWDAGQLEQELYDHSWLVCDAYHDIIFHPDQDMKWALALRHMGVDPLMLSDVGGTA